MKPQEAIIVRKDLRRQIKRAHHLAARCMAQTADGDLPIVDRESAEKRALMTIRAREQLERSLNTVQGALNPRPIDEAEDEQYVHRALMEDQEDRLSEDPV
jgi:hypothetical protein